MAYEYEQLIAGRQSLTLQQGFYIDDTKGLAISSIYGPSLRRYITEQMDDRVKIEEALRSLEPHVTAEIDQLRFLRRPLLSAGYLMNTLYRHLVQQASDGLD